MINRITESLYIGDWQDAHRNRHHFTIFTVAFDSPFVGEYHFKLVDGPSPDNEKILREAITKLNTLIEKGEKVLVHCVSGISRSSAVIAGYLVTQGMDLESAVTMLTIKRPVTKIVPALYELLSLYQDKTKGPKLLLCESCLDWKTERCFKYPPDTDWNSLACEQVSLYQPKPKGES